MTASVVCTRINCFKGNILKLYWDSLLNTFLPIMAWIINCVIRCSGNRLIETYRYTYTIINNTSVKHQIILGTTAVQKTCWDPRTLGQDNFFFEILTPSKKPFCRTLRTARPCIVFFLNVRDIGHRRLWIQHVIIHVNYYYDRNIVLREKMRIRRRRSFNSPPRWIMNERILFRSAGNATLCVRVDLGSFPLSGKKLPVILSVHVCVSSESKIPGDNRRTPPL